MQTLETEGGRTAENRPDPVELHFRKNFREKIRLVQHPQAADARPRVLDAGRRGVVARKSVKILG